MKFAVLSDTHYLSEKMICADAPPEARLKNKIIRSLFSELAGTDAFDTILITGDLTHAGDVESHREYIAMLRAIRDAGKRVYVLTATHDFQFSRAFAVMEGWRVGYREHPWQKAWFDPEGFDFKRIVKPAFADLPAAACVPPLKAVCTPEMLWEMYREFGRDQAFSVFAPDYSYCVRLDEKIWCLMLNNNFRDIDPQENMSASYSPGCLRWIEEIVRQAREAGAFVFACTHHPLVPPVPAYKIGGKDRNMRRAYVAHMLADLGVPLVFSGHTHFADVGFASSERGNVLCDITTPSPVTLPPMYRIAQLNDACDRIRLTAVPIRPDESFGVEETTMRAYFENRFIAEYREKTDALPLCLGKVLRSLKVKHLYPLCRCAKLTPAQYASVKDTLLFDIIMQLVVNMQCGDGQYTPDTAIYRFMMGLAAAADSMIDAQPFVDLRKKLMGYSVREIIEPMLFNNYVPDGDAEFAFRELPSPNYPTEVFRSHAGEILMAVLSAFAVLLSPVARAAACVALPALTAAKKIRLKTNPPAPERY